MITLKDVQLSTFYFDDFYDEWIKEIDNEIIALNLAYHKNMPENEFVNFIHNAIDLERRKQLLQDLKKASNESKIRIDDLEGSLQMLNLYNKEPERFVE